MPRLSPFALAAIVSAACGPRKAEPATQPPRVVVETRSGPRAVVVEIARNDRERNLGLMYRRSLPGGAGMLFLFEESAEHWFWMKNTFIPLDMIFLDEAGRIVGIVERAEPLTLTARGVGVPSRYVLEVNGGWAAANGVTPGDRVRFENVPR